MSKKTQSVVEERQEVDTRPWLVAIVISYLFFAIAYNLVTPAGGPIQHNPDENGHLQYIQRLVEGHLPVFRGAVVGPEYHQPPLYYLLCAPVYEATKGLGPSTSMHCVRAVSTVLGIFLILATFRCVRRLLPDEPWAALLAAGFVGLLPMNVAMNASVGNDLLTNLLVSEGLLLLVNIAVRASDAGAANSRGSILLGVVLGLIILTKSSALVLFPAVVVGFAVLAYQKSMSTNDAVRACATALVIGVVIGSPWLIRNTMLYGDPLGTKLFLRSFPDTAQASGFVALLGGGGYEALVARWTFASFWGVFDQMSAWWGAYTAPGRYLSLTAPLPPLYAALAVLSVVPLLGLIGWFRRSTSTSPQISMLAALVVLLLGTGYGFEIFTMKFFQAQGRYWFTSLVPLALFFALGYRGLFSRELAYRAVAILLLIGFVALNAYTIWGLLIPRFAGAS